MRKAAIATLIFAATLTGTAAFAQQKMDDMKGMDMKSMDMKSMDMKDMQGMKMEGMSADKPAASNARTYWAVGVVKALDAAAGTVTFDHEAVKSLNWPAMTMSFNVKDKTLFDRLAQGKKVQFEFVEEGEKYVVTAVK